MIWKGSSLHYSQNFCKTSISSLFYAKKKLFRFYRKLILITTDSLVNAKDADIIILSFPQLVQSVYCTTVTASSIINWFMLSTCLILKAHASVGSGVILGVDQKSKSSIQQWELGVGSSEASAYTVWYIRYWNGGLRIM